MREPNSFADLAEGLRRGDFTLLDPLFASGEVIRWHQEGKCGAVGPEVLAEALTCACFNGRVETAKCLLAQGVDPAGGQGTGLNALHWAVNRGQLDCVLLLLKHPAPPSLETLSMYQGTALGTAVWASVHETKPRHLEVIEQLLIAGADIRGAEYPSGRDDVDALLRRFGAES
jgi:hypothetical protein